VAEQDTEGDRLRENKYAGLKDLKPLANDPAYVRDVMTRFEQVGFDAYRPNPTKRRTSQASKGRSPGRSSQQPIRSMENGEAKVEKQVSS